MIRKFSGATRQHTPKRVDIDTSIPFAYPRLAVLQHSPVKKARQLNCWPGEGYRELADAPHIYGSLFGVGKTCRRNSFGACFPTTRIFGGASFHLGSDLFPEFRRIISMTVVSECEKVSYTFPSGADMPECSTRRMAAQEILQWFGNDMSTIGDE